VILLGIAKISLQKLPPTRGDLAKERWYQDYVFFGGTFFFFFSWMDGNGNIFRHCSCLFILQHLSLQPGSNDIRELVTQTG
jgi:hypothetical protein